MSEAEKKYALRQDHEIAAEDGYFYARPQIDSLDRRKVFSAGFDRGWYAALAAAPAKSKDKTTIQEALSALKSAMSADPECAWSWHCYICMPIVDCGAASHKDANVAAARIMRGLFGVDMENSTRYVEWMTNHTAPAQPDTSAEHAMGYAEGFNDACAPAQPRTHPDTGEPYGTAAQEATAWRLKAENLERENAGVAAGSRWKINTPS